MALTRATDKIIGNVDGNLNLSGIVTASSFRGDGSQLTGVDASTLKNGSDTKAQANASGVVVTGVLTATSFRGDGSNLTNLPAGLGTALSSDQTSANNKLYYTNRVLSIGSTTTVDHPATASGAYTQYAEIQIEDNADLIIEDGDDLIPDILGLGDNGSTGAGGLGRLRVDTITNKGANGAPNFPNGLTGTSGTFTGNLNVGGVLTYEDVTNVDSVGVITARSTIDAQGDVSIADKIIHTGDTNTAIRFPSADTITAETGGTERLRIKSDASSVSIGSSVFLGIKTTLITNGDFSNGTTNWTASGSSIAVSSGVLTLTPNSGVNGFASQAVTNLVVGTHYNVQVTVTEDAGTYSRLYVGTSATGSQNVTNVNLGVGTHSFSFKATATTHYVSLVVGGGTGQATKFDNVRLIESNSISFSTPTGDAPSLRPHAFEGMSINTGGADRLIVSKDGHVTKPSHPSFHARLINHTNATANPLVFDSVIVNVGSHYKSTGSDAGKFVVPVAGTYFFFWEAIKNGSSGVTRLYIRKNGSRIYNDMHLRLQEEGNYANGCMNIIITLAVGDKIHIDLAAGGVHASEYTHFGGYLIG